MKQTLRPNNVNFKNIPVIGTRLWFGSIPTKKGELNGNEVTLTGFLQWVERLNLLYIVDFCLCDTCVSVNLNKDFWIILLEIEFPEQSIHC